MKEIISIGVGQAGVNLCTSLWDRQIREHDLLTSTAFDEKDNGNLKPRTVLVDTDPDMRMIVKRDFPEVASMIDLDQMITGAEGSGDNYIRGHYTIGREVLNPSLEAIRRQVEQCDNLEALIIHSAIAGGTGSGLMCLLLERLSGLYQKKARINNLLYASNSGNVTNVVEPYNAVLST